MTSAPYDRGILSTTCSHSALRGFQFTFSGHYAAGLSRVNDVHAEVFEGSEVLALVDSPSPGRDNVEIPSDWRVEFEP